MEIFFDSKKNLKMVPRGIIKNSQKICKISEISFYLKEHDIIILTSQVIQLPDDSFPRYDFSKCEISTSNFGP